MSIPFSLLPLATAHSFDVDKSGSALKVTSTNGLDPQVIHAAGIVGVAHSVVFFAAIAAIIFIVVWGRVRRSRMQHETIRMLVDKGVPIPPELFQAAPVQRNDLRKGLIWMAIGLGFGSLSFVGPAHNQNVWAVGMIPFLIGVAFLIAWKFDSAKS